MTTFPWPQLPPAARGTFSIEDWWVSALDGCMVQVGDMAYPVVVEGIHRGVDGDVWIQLAPFHEADRDALRVDRGVTLHCDASHTPDDAFLTLRAHVAVN